MSRRRRSSGNNSLELLLDTICNTFGGILFLALLVCLLLRNSSARSDVEADAAGQDLAMQAASREYESLLVEFRTLEAAEQQQELLRGRLADDDAEKLLAQWKAAGQARDRVVLDKTRLLHDIAQANTRIAATEAADRQLEAELRGAEQRLQLVRSRLERASKHRTRTAHIPRLRASTKSDFSVLLRYGRVYLWHRYDGNGRRIGLNTDDCVVVEDQGYACEVTPKPYAGVPVGGPQWESKLKNALRDIDPREHKVAMLVWPDSFEQFQDVKTVVVNLGFEYRIMPMGVGDKVVDRGGSRSDVQ